ncbi:M10 family metallopeptidase C-terminal domain-containing protein [Proteus columbae]|uniref:M10 family metallopeptidase C-terminal domain-containing protein n=1 Tax=Proteus columbae TaxID=1987580 RepID=UPI000C1F158A|nr:M10 family metallopeptidase C-terminal domain-containing protein [Proteus columbae]
MSAIYKHDISKLNEIIKLIKSFKPLMRWAKQDPNSEFTEVTFSFPNWSQLRGDKYKTLTTFNEHQKKIAKKVLQQWSDVANINFVEKDTKHDTHIKFGAFNNINEITKDNSHLVAGVATFPLNNIEPNKKIEKITDYSIGGHVWINISSTTLIKKFNKNEITPEQKNKINLFKEKSDNIKYYYIETDTHITLYKNSNENGHINNQPIILEKGNSETQTYIHETGHALGLPHTFRANDPNNPDIEENSLKYSIMSYRYPKIEDADFIGLFPMSPLLIDIYVIQKFYGVNVTTRTGDTIYGFNSNTERDFYSLYMPDDIIISCIWDAGGNDTLDFSKYNIEQKINLNQGSFSDVGGLKSNISIAYGAIIENAIGGENNDHIIGNEVNNNLFGGKGSDIIYGHDGDDNIFGGEDSDALYGNEGNDFINGEDGRDIISGGNGHNTLFGGKHADMFFFEISDKTNSHNKIMDYNIHEDFLIFLDENKTNLNIENLLSQNLISFKMSYQKEYNLTKLEIKTNEKLEAPNLTIDIVGNFSYEDLFC